MAGGFVYHVGAAHLGLADGAVDHLIVGTVLGAGGGNFLFLHRVAANVLAGVAAGVTLAVRPLVVTGGLAALALAGGAVPIVAQGLVGNSGTADLRLADGAVDHLVVRTGDGAGGVLDVLLHRGLRLVAGGLIGDGLAADLRLADGTVDHFVVGAILGAGGGDFILADSRAGGVVGAGFGHLPHQHGIAVVDVAGVLLEGVAQRGQHGVGLQLSGGLEGGGVLGVLALLAHQLSADALKGVDLEITVGSLLQRNNIAGVQLAHGSADGGIVAAARHLAGGVAVAYLTGAVIMGVGCLIHKLNARDTACRRAAGYVAGIVAIGDLTIIHCYNTTRLSSGNTASVGTALNQTRRTGSPSGNTAYIAFGLIGANITCIQAAGDSLLLREGLGDNPGDINTSGSLGSSSKDRAVVLTICQSNAILAITKSRFTNNAACVSVGCRH